MCRPISARNFQNNFQTQIALRSHQRYYAVVCVAFFGSSGGTSCWFLDCPIGDCRLFGQMPGPLSHHWRKRAEDLRRQMQTAIGQQLRVKYELPQELPPELAMLLIRMDEKPEEQCTAHHKGPLRAERRPGE